jgi:membrane associated rhomboid family serine protease
MSDVATSPLEYVLGLVAAAAPRPWYPRPHARDTDTDPKALLEVIEQAWLEKLVEKAEGTPASNPGFLLTPLGEQVLEDPEARQRFRDGAPLDESDPGAVVRASLRRPARPTVTRLILLANVLVFLVGLYLAGRANKAQLFLWGLSPDPKVTEIQHETGSMNAGDFLKGEWWRLLTLCFVHAGLLHIGMNMYALKNVGGFVEQTWGPFRYLLIYLLAGWGGSCLGIAMHPTAEVVGKNAQGQVVVVKAHPLEQMGASGALCGVLGAAGVWVLLYGKYLPRGMARRGRTQMTVNLVLIVFLSLLPMVSGWGHLGGGLAGALVALILHFQRFGPPGVRWLALLVLLPLPWLGYRFVDYQQAHSPRWAKLREAREERPPDGGPPEGEKPGKGRPEEKRPPRKEDGLDEREEQEFGKRFLTKKGPTSIRRVMADAKEVYEEAVAALVEMHPSRRDPRAVKEALAALEKQRKSVTELATALAKAGPYKNEDVENARKTARDYARAQEALFQLAERCLAEGNKFPRKDEQRLEEQASKVEALRKRWHSLLE